MEILIAVVLLVVSIMNWPNTGDKNAGFEINDLTKYWPQVRLEMQSRPNQSVESKPRLMVLRYCVQLVLRGFFVSVGLTLWPNDMGMQWKY